MSKKSKFVASCQKRKSPDAAWKYSIIQHLNAEQQGVASSAGSAGFSAWTQSLGLGDVGGDRSGTYGRVQNTKYLHYAIHTGRKLKRERRQLLCSRTVCRLCLCQNSLARHFLTTLLLIIIVSILPYCHFIFVTVIDILLLTIITIIITKFLSSYLISFFCSYFISLLYSLLFYLSIFAYTLMVCLLFM